MIPAPRAYKFFARFAVSIVSRALIFGPGHFFGSGQLPLYTVKPALCSRSATEPPRSWRVSSSALCFHRWAIKGYCVFVSGRPLGILHSIASVLSSSFCLHSRFHFPISGPRDSFRAGVNVDCRHTFVRCQPGCWTNSEILVQSAEVQGFFLFWIIELVVFVSNVLFFPFI